MREFKGTKGKWELRKGGCLIGIYCGEQQVAITNSVNRESNAKLIAAAPELLETLQNFIYNDEFSTEDYVKAKELINTILE